MYCERTQGDISAGDCSTLIVDTTDRSLFAFCDACPQGQRLIASVQRSSDEETEPKRMDAAGVTKTVRELCMPRKITINDLAIQAGVRRHSVYDARKRARAGRPSQAGAAGEVEDWLREQGFTWDDVYGVCDYDEEPAPAAPPPTMPSPLEHVCADLDMRPGTTTVAPAPMSAPAPQHHCVDVGNMVKASAPVMPPVESVPSPMDAPALCAAWATAPTEAEKEPERREAMPPAPDISTPATAPVLMSASAAPVLPLDRQPLDAILAELSRRLPGANLHIPL